MRRVRQPGTDTQGAIPLSSGAGRSPCDRCNEVVGRSRGRQSRQRGVRSRWDADVSDRATDRERRTTDRPDAVRRSPAPGAPATAGPTAGSSRSPPTGRSPLEGGGPLARRRPSPTRPGATLDADGVERRAGLPRPRPATATPPGRLGPGHPTAGLVGRPGRARAGASTPTASSSCAPTCSAAARARPGPASPDPADRPAVRLALPGRHDPRHGPHPGRARRPPRHRPLACGLGGSMGGMQVARVGRHVPRPGARRSSRSPPAPQATRPADRLVARSAAGRSRLDPSWRGGDYYDAAPGDGPHDGPGARPRWSPRSRSAATTCSPTGSAASVVEPLDGASRCGSASRSSATSTTTATSSSAASTPTLPAAHKAMDLHDLGRGRGGARAAALAGSRVPTLSLGIDSATCSTPYQQRQIVDACPPAGARPATSRSTAPHGHDAFLHRPRPGRRASLADFLDRRGEAPMTDRPRLDRPGRPRPADRHPETRAIRAGRADNGTVAGPAAVGHHDLRDADRRRAPRGMATTPSAPTASTAATATRRCGASRTPSPSSRAPRRRWPSRRAWARSPRVVLGLCSTGDHIVAQRQIYAGTQLLLQASAPASASTSPSSTAPSPAPSPPPCGPGKTMLVFAETPANPRLDLVDLDELGAIAGPITVVDSTFATPLVQRPLDHGVDLVAALGHQGHRRPQRRHARRGRRQPTSSSTGSGASPCSRAPTPRRSTP